MCIRDRLTAVLKGMKDVAPEDRPKVGQWVNETREAVEKPVSYTHLDVYKRQR